MTAKNLLNLGFMIFMVIALGIASCSNGGTNFGNSGGFSSQGLEGDQSADSNTDTNPNGTAASTQEIQTEEEIAAINRKAIDNRDSEACNDIENAKDKAICQNNVIITKASDAHDTSMCDAIESEQWKMSCKDSVILVTARDTKNPSLCEQMSEKGRIPECRTLASG